MADSTGEGFGRGKIKRSHVFDALWWLLYAGLGGLLPVWGVALLLWGLNTPAGIGELAAHGEFLIYSAAFAAPIIHKIQREGAVPQRLVLFLTIVTLLAAVILYALIQVVDKGGLTVAFDPTRVVFIGYYLFALSVGLAFVATVFENVQVFSDPRAARSASEKRLEEQFDALGAESGQ